MPLPFIKSKKKHIAVNPGLIENLISKLTLEEKASLCSGKDVWNTKAIKRLDIPSMMMTDGPHGVRKQVGLNDNIGLFDSVPATCFPTASALGSSWNRDLLEEIGVALAQECQHEDISMILGPGINIKRSPLCGRNFEYFSEDPFITAELATAMVIGIQSMGISACLKHFAVNNQEKYRMTINAIVDERALHEIYLYAFERVISKANPWAVMVSYNKLNGFYTGESPYLLQDTLRNKWGYQGVVVTDWGSTNDRVKALQVGVDLEMPSSGSMHDVMIIKAVTDKQIPLEVLNEAVRRNLLLLFSTRDAKIPNYRYSQSKHHALAKKAAVESIVLLKNDKVTNKNINDTDSFTTPLLPLEKNKKVAIIGQFAKHPRFQGAGSSLIRPTKLENIYHFAKKDMKDALVYAKGYSRHSDQIDPFLLTEAKEAAAQADIVILMVGLPDSYESEGFDRIHIKLPSSHESLIKEISDINSNVIVILSNGAPVDMPWANRVPCIVEAYLLGQAGGSALWDVITGNMNPSGKIAESFPLTLEDTSSYPYYPMGPRKVEYRESIFVGYRYYEKINLSVLFPFGHGLSYTTFGYNDLAIENSAFNFSQKENYWISVTIENTGDFSGKEIIQLYVKDNSGKLVKPEKELKGFEKVFLHPKEKKRVSIFLDKSCFAYYSTSTHSWTVVDGIYTILVGSSSKDIRVEAQVIIKSGNNKKSKSHDTPENEVINNKTESDYFDILLKNHSATSDEFQQFLGNPINEPEKGVIQYHSNSTMEDCMDHWLCRLMYKIILHKVKIMTKDNKLQQNTMRQVLLELPLRGLALMSNGVFTYKHLDAFIFWINKKRLKAIKTLFFH